MPNYLDSWRSSLHLIRMTCSTSITHLSYHCVFTPLGILWSNHGTWVLCEESFYSPVGQIPIQWKGRRKINVWFYDSCFMLPSKHSRYWKICKMQAAASLQLVDTSVVGWKLLRQGCGEAWKHAGGGRTEELKREAAEPVAVAKAKSNLITKITPAQPFEVQVDFSSQCLQFVKQFAVPFNWMYSCKHPVTSFCHAHVHGNVLWLPSPVKRYVEPSLLQDLQEQWCWKMAGWQCSMRARCQLRGRHGIVVTQSPVFKPVFKPPTFNFQARVPCWSSMSCATVKRRSQGFLELPFTDQVHPLWICVLQWTVLVWSPRQLCWCWWCFRRLRKLREESGVLFQDMILAWRWYILNNHPISLMGV